MDHFSNSTTEPVTWERMRDILNSFAFYMQKAHLSIEEEDIMLANAGSIGLEEIQLQFLQNFNDIHQAVPSAALVHFDGYFIVHYPHIHLRPILRRPLQPRASQLWTVDGKSIIPFLDYRMTVGCTVSHVDSIAGSVSIHRAPSPFGAAVGSPTLLLHEKLQLLHRSFQLFHVVNGISNYRSPVCLQFAP